MQIRLNLTLSLSLKCEKKKAFQQAWEAACNVEASTVLVPSGSVFLVKIVSFEGRICQPNINFQV